MVDRTLDAAAERCRDPEGFMSRAAYAHGIVDPADRAAEVAHLQARYNLAYRMWHRSDAPPISPDETLAAYMRRLPMGLVRFSDKFGGTNFSRLDDSSLRPLAKMLIDNVTERFQRPDGGERSYTTRDQAGREIRHFCGGGEDGCWLPFTNAVANNGEAVGWKTGRIDHRLCTGENGFEARALRAQAAARRAAAERALVAQEARASAGG